MFRVHAEAVSSPNRLTNTNRKWEQEQQTLWWRGKRQTHIHVQSNTDTEENWPNNVCTLFYYLIHCTFHIHLECASLTEMQSQKAPCWSPLRNEFMGVMWGSTTEAGAYQGHNFVTVVSSHNWPRGIFTYHDLTLTRVRLWFGWFLQNETRDKRTGTGHPRCSCWSLIAQGQGVTWNYIHLCA